MTTPESQLEDHLIEKLRGLKYEYRADIGEVAVVEKNFRETFEMLKPVRSTQGSFSGCWTRSSRRMAARTLRSIKPATREAQA